MKLSGSLTWWEIALSPKLSQGDVIQGVPVCAPVCPSTFLQSQTLKNSAKGWRERNDPHKSNDGRVYVLAAGRGDSALVLSHDCELDKDMESGRVMVAPLIPLSSTEPDVQQQILNQDVFACLPLPDLHGYDEIHFADFRLSFSLHRGIVNFSKRIASMSKSGRERLWMQIDAFYVRKDFRERP